MSQRRVWVSIGLRSCLSFLLATMLAVTSLVAVMFPASATTSGLAVDTRFSQETGVVQAIAKGEAGWLVAGSNLLTLLNNDGSPNTTFNDSLGTGLGGVANAITVAADGDGWLVGGRFDSFNGEPVNNLIRLNADGTLDPSFTANIGINFNAYVHTIEPDGSGGWLIGGQFYTNGSHLIRVSGDGTLDSSLSAAFGSWIPNGSHVYSTAGDGEGWLVGTFLQLSQVIPLFKFNSVGELDQNFMVNAVGSGFDGYVKSVARDEAGSGWLVGGSFTQANGIPAGRLLRLNDDGTRDTAFDAALGSGFNAMVNVVVADTDGWLVGGSFSSLNGQPNTGRLVRLNADGTIDTSFADNLGSGPNDYVNSINVEDTGRIILGGVFSSIGGTLRARIAALVPTELTVGPVIDQSNLVGENVSVPIPATATTTTWGSLPTTSYAATGLPAGLGIDAATGEITGTPTTVGTGTVTVSAKSTLLTDSTTFTWTINQGPTISGIPADGAVGINYSHTFTTTGTPPVSAVSVSDGTLPPGLTLSTAGVLSGVPTAAGDFSFTVSATNGTGTDATLDVMMTIQFAVPTVSMTLKHESRKIGDEQVATGTGYLPGEQVNVTVTSAQIQVGHVIADESGIAELSFEVPEAELASHPVVMSGQTSRAQASANFTIISDTNSGGNKSGDEAKSANIGKDKLPLTGPGLILTALVLAGLLTVTGTLILANRRRSQKQR